MRICLVVRALPCHRLGGLEYHTLDLANGLARRGHDVTILTSRHPEAVAEEVLPSGVRVRYLDRGRPGDYSPAFFRGMEQALGRLEKEVRQDIVHAQEFAGFFLSARPGRMVSTVHGTLFTETPLNGRYFRRLSLREKLSTVWRFKPRPVLYPVFRRMIARSDMLVVDSDFTRRELLLMDGTLRPKIRLVPLGVDPSRYPAADALDRKADVPEAAPLRIALLGRVQKMKGLEVAVRAADLLHRRGVSFRMEVGGSGDYLEELRAEVSRRGLEDRVIISGRIPEENVSEFLGAADLFLFPDLTQPAFGLVAVEAMMHGLPVVAARSGAIPEVVSEEVGWLYEPWDAPELAALLERLAVQRGQVRGRAENARSHAALYSAEGMAAGVEQVYRDLLSPDL